MFPIPWNKAYRKKDGTIVNIDDAMGGGGGGSEFFELNFYNKTGTSLIHREYVKSGDDCLYSYGDNEWSDEASGTAVEGILDNITEDLDLYYVGIEYNYYWDFTKSALDEFASKAADLNKCSRNYDGLAMTISEATADLGGVFLPNSTLVIKFGTVEFAGNTSYHETMITFGAKADGNGLIFNYSDNKWELYTGSWQVIDDEGWSGSDKRNIFSNKVLKIHRGSDNKLAIYLDDTLVDDGLNMVSASTLGIVLGNGRTQLNGGQCQNTIFKAVGIASGLV